MCATCTPLLPLVLSRFVFVFVVAVQAPSLQSFGRCTSASRLPLFPCNGLLGAKSRTDALLRSLRVCHDCVVGFVCGSQAWGRSPCAMMLVASALLGHAFQPFTARATCLISELPSTTSPATTYRLVSYLPLSRPLLTRTLCLHRLIDPGIFLAAVEVRPSAVLFGWPLLYLDTWRVSLQVLTGVPPT